MKVLIACEESQVVTSEFRRIGHEAYSCDILPCSGGHPEWHIQGDVIPLLKEEWDLIIAHPPCTYLTTTGNKWMKPEFKERFPNRLEQRKEAIKQTEGASNSRGLMGRSSFAGGFGLGDERKNTVIDAFNRNKAATETDLTRFLEGNKIERERKVTDMRTNLQRKEFDLEQNRRKESADLANIRGQRALSRFNSSLI